MTGDMLSLLLIAAAAAPWVILAARRDLLYLMCARRG
jgi:hypothetical protein